MENFRNIPFVPKEEAYLDGTMPVGKYPAFLPNSKSSWISIAANYLLESGSDLAYDFQLPLPVVLYLREQRMRRPKDMFVYYNNGVMTYYIVFIDGKSEKVYEEIAEMQGDANYRSPHSTSACGKDGYYIRYNGTPSYSSAVNEYDHKFQMLYDQRKGEYIWVPNNERSFLPSNKLRGFSPGSYAVIDMNITNEFYNSPYVYDANQNLPFQVIQKSKKSFKEQFLACFGIE